MSVKKIVTDACYGCSGTVDDGSVRVKMYGGVAMADVVLTQEQQVALVKEAKERMNARARSWLDDSKVHAALTRFSPDDLELQKAG